MPFVKDFSIMLRLFIVVFWIGETACVSQSVGKMRRYRSGGNSVDGIGIPLCPEIPARYAFLKPNTKVGDVISGGPPSAVNFPSLYYIKDGNEHRLFGIDKNSGRVYVAMPISLPLLLMNHKLTVIVSSGLKTCSMKIYIQAAAFKQSAERSFFVPSPRVDPADKFSELEAIDHPEPRQLFLPTILSGNPLESDPGQQQIVPIQQNNFQNIIPNQQNMVASQHDAFANQQNTVPFQPSIVPSQQTVIENQPYNVFTTPLPFLTTTLDISPTSPFVAVPVEAMDILMSKQGALPTGFGNQPAPVANFGTAPAPTAFGTQPAPPSTFGTLGSSSLAFGTQGTPAAGFGTQNSSPAGFGSQPGNANGIISQFPVLANAPGNYPSVPVDTSPAIPGSNGTLQRPPPLCSQPLYTGIVAESAPIGTFVIRAIATGDRVQWTISDTAFERFSVNPTTGEVSVAGSLKRRTRAAMEFKLRATDAFGLWCDAVVRINVVSDTSATPSNYPPYFTQNYYYFTIQCGTSGQRVGSVVASDTDAGQTVTYQVINSNEFSVDTNGNIQSTTPIQTSAQRIFMVTAVDTGFPPQTATTSVAVTVAGSCGPSNANTPPTFTQSTYILSASCRVNGVFVGMISARDYENNAIRYSLTGTSEFTINPTTGELRAQGSLNDAAPRTFSALATDNGIPSMSAVASINVNVANCSPPNNPPTFSQSAFQFTVPCGTAAGTTVGSAQAYDSEGNQITYSLTGTQEFSVNSATGSMSLTSPLQGIGLRQYGMVATDNGQPPLSSSAGITVVVNGNCGPSITTTPAPIPFSTPAPPPTIFTSPPLFLTTAPNVPASPYFQQPVFSGSIPCLTSTGSTIGTFPAFYAAGPQFLTYSLLGTSEFTVSNNGTVTNAVLLPSGATRTFTIVAADPRFPSATASAQIIINVGICPQTPTTPAPVPPPTFPQSQYVASVSCITSPGFVIGTMTAQYALPQQLTYNLAGTNAFTIDNSGRLTNTVALDGAVVPSYTFTVIAADSRNTASSGTAVVVINVQPCVVSTTPTTTVTTTPALIPPSFQLAQYFANISCLTNPGFLIGTITAQYNRPLTYSLVNTNAFTVDNFGQVTNTVPVNGAVVPTYFFAIVARDAANPAVSTTAQVVISVGACVPPSTLPPPTLPPTPAPTPPPFVFTTPPPVIPTPPPFVFTTPPFVFPTSGPTTPPPFVPTPPRFTQQQYTFSIACQNNGGISVGSVTVQYQQPQQLGMSLTGTNEFRVDNSGQITTVIPVNGAQRPVYNFNVVAQDFFNPSLTATAQIVVNVAACSVPTPPFQPVTQPTTPVAPLPPQFLQGQYVFNVQCLNVIGNPIGTVTAQYSQPQQLVYNLVSTNSFGITSTGQISNTVLLNGAIQPSMTFTVVAADSRNPILSATAQVIVNIAPCATPAPPTLPPTPPPTQPPRPIFPQAQYTANISCLTSVGFLVGTVTAQYPQQLVYTLVNAKYGLKYRSKMSSVAPVLFSSFNVDNFGQIRNTVPLNGAQIPSYPFTIIASDSRNPSNSALAQITVFVGVCSTTPTTTTVAIFTPPVTFPTVPTQPPPVTFPTPPPTPRPIPPQFSQSQYTTFVACQNAPGFPVGTITAQYSQPQQLSYTLTGTSSFSVNNAGQITNLVPLDGALIPTYTFTITAIDARNPSLSASAQVSITVSPCTTTTTPATTPPTPPALRPPVFSQNSYFFTVQCLSNPGSQIGTVQATDPTGSPIVYRLIGTPSEFDVDPSRGSIVLSRQPTNSGIRAIIVVAIGANPSQSATTTVQISVTEPCILQTQPPFTVPITLPPVTTTTPALPAPPRFTQGLYLFTYGCAPNSNQPIGTVQATGSQLTYSLQGTNAFTIASTGEIRPVSALQGPQTMTFQVVASDNAGGAVRADVAQVQVSVSACTTPQPAQAPFFQQATYSMVVVCPSSPNILVGTVTAQYSQPQNLVYNLINANQFSVDNSGEIRSTILLSSGSNYFFTVTAFDLFDSRNPSVSASAQVSVNVLPCTTLQPSTVPTVPTPATTPPVLIAFNQALYSFLATCPVTVNQVVGSVQAYGTGIRYGLTGTTNFTISQTGQISILGSLQGPLLLPFRATATAPDGTSFGVDVQVSIPSCLVPTQPPPVTPEVITPTFAQSAYTLNVGCPSSPNILVGTVTAQYSQPQNLVYSLFNTNEFSVDNFGEVRSTVLLTPATSYTFAIIATDSRNPAAVAISRVTVEVSQCGGQPTPAPPFIFSTPPVFIGSTLPPSFTPGQQVSTPGPNAAPYFTNPTYTFTVVCSSQPGTAIGSVYAIDDSSQVLYSIQSPSFTINPSSGEIFVSAPITTNTPSTFTVIASDVQGLTGQASVTVSVSGCGVPTPSTPVINQPTVITVSVCDPATNMVVPGMALGVISASSPSPGNGPAGGLQFSLLSDRRFAVNPVTGQISAAATLDSGSYLFPVQIMDPRLPQLSSTATFTVIVDCASISYRPCNPSYIEATVSEGAAVGVTVITLSGNTVGPVNTRPYSSPYTSSSSYYNNVPTYYQQNSMISEQYAQPPTPYYGSYPVSNTGGSSNGMNLGGSSGGMNNQYASLDGPARGYRMLPMLRRGAPPPRMMLRERRQAGGSLLAALQSPVGAALAGSGMGAPQGWSIQQASVPGQFRLDATSGRIYVAQPLDRERTDSYVLRVRNTYGNQICVTRVGIDVLDVNDNAPIFNNATYAFTAACGVPNALVGVVTARDADSGLRGFVSYTLLNSDNSAFTMDLFSGEIRSRTPVSPETLPQTITIQADNPSTPPRSTTTSATVNPGVGC